MKTNCSTKPLISFFRGAFCDENLEKEFIQHDISHAIKYIQPMVLILGILYFLFIIPDYFNIEDGKTFIIILLNRTLLLCCFVVFYVRLKRAKSYTFYYRWITFYNILVFAFFIFVLYHYESPNILIQTFGLMLIVIGTFLVPNRWINAFFIALVFSVAFFIVAAVVAEEYYVEQRLAAGIYLVLVIFFSSISSLRTNYYKRIQYIQQKQLRHMAITDPLTGSYNRNKFNRDLRGIFQDKSPNMQASAILLDFDDFKKINDQYGHMNGDKVLIESVALFGTVLKKEDVLARWGGEEFMILLRGASLIQAVDLARKIVLKLNNYAFGDVKNVTCSFGVANIHECEMEKDFLNLLDLRLHLAKKQGKNRIVHTSNKDNIN